MCFLSSGSKLKKIAPIQILPFLGRGWQHEDKSLSNEHKLFIIMVWNLLLALTLSITFSKRFGCRSWDPEDERRRQEQWQHEQERLLQVLPFPSFRQRRQQGH